MRSEYYRGFEVFGTRVGIFLGVSEGDRSPALRGIEVEALMRRLHQQLTRFDPDSQLCRLNDDERETVPVSPALAALAQSAIDAGRLTDGLVDATLIDAIKRCGYDASRVGVEPAPLASAIAASPNIGPRGLPRRAPGNR